MLGTLLDRGYELVQDPGDAEVVLINSCAFIGEAKQESIDAILEHARYKETGSCKALVVAGCLTQRYAEVLQTEMPEVDYFVGTSAYPKIAQILKGERDRAVIPDPDYIADSHTPRRNSMPKWTAYVHIADPVLRRMKRGRDSAWVRKLVRKLRDRVPDLTFRTSFIVGFPGETESQFNELCEFVEEMRFDKVGVFQFSREEGTGSYDLD